MYKVSGQLKVQGLQNIYCANTNQMKARVHLLISDEANLRTRKVMGDSEEYFIMIKGQFVGSSKRYSNLKCGCIQQHKIKICEEKTDRTARKN